MSASLEARPHWGTQQRRKLYVIGALQTVNIGVTRQRSRAPPMRELTLRKVRTTPCTCFSVAILREATAVRTHPVQPTHRIADLVPRRSVRSHRLILPACRRPRSVEVDDRADRARTYLWV